MGSFSFRSVGRVGDRAAVSFQRVSLNVPAYQEHCSPNDPWRVGAQGSYIERQNLTMRMNMRRFTWLTNAFSKKIENHAAAVALHFMVYNFARPHKSLKNPYPRTPAMAAGVTDHLWSLTEIAGLLD